MTHPDDAGFVYVDTETTGLDPRLHSAFELSWAVDNGPIDSLILPHRLRRADPEALAVNRYHERGMDPRLAVTGAQLRTHLGDFLAAFTGPDGAKRSWAGCNPRFDVGHLWGKVIGRDPWAQRARRFLGLTAAAPPVEPWAYRLIDVEVYAAGVFGWPKPLGLTKLRDHLVGLGFTIPMPDHTGAGDVATTRACHQALMRCVDWRQSGQDPDALRRHPITHR